MGLLRSIAERLARGRVFWRRLPNGVQIAVSPDAQLKYLGGRFDTDLLALARNEVAAGSVVWDIGANCGTFAFSCETASKVIAIEADSFLADLLRRSASRCAIPVKVIEAAVSDVVGTASFSVAARGRASSHLSAVAGSSQSGGERSRIEVPTVSLDALFNRHGPPDFIKIDIEGAETLALRGGAELLEKVRPTIYLEVSHNTRRELRATLEAAGYAIDDRVTTGSQRPSHFLESSR